MQSIVPEVPGVSARTDVKCSWLLAKCVTDPCFALNAGIGGGSTGVRKLSIYAVSPGHLPISGRNAFVTSPAAPPVRIGVEIGGTFTDLQIFDARTRAISGLKTLTTPDDPSIGLMTGIRRSAQLNGFALVDVGYLVHGTTIATNAVLARTFLFPCGYRGPPRYFRPS